MDCKDCRYMGETSRILNACARVDGRWAAGIKTTLVEPVTGAPYERVVTTLKGWFREIGEATHYGCYVGRGGE